MEAVRDPLSETTRQPVMKASADLSELIVELVAVEAPRASVGMCAGEHQLSRRENVLGQAGGGCKEEPRCGHQIDGAEGDAIPRNIFQEERPRKEWPTHAL